MRGAGRGRLPGRRVPPPVPETQPRPWNSRRSSTRISRVCCSPVIAPPRGRRRQASETGASGRPRGREPRGSEVDPGSGSGLASGEAGGARRRVSPSPPRRVARPRACTSDRRNSSTWGRGGTSSAGIYGMAGRPKRCVPVSLVASIERDRRRPSRSGGAPAHRPLALMGEGGNDPPQDVRAVAPARHVT